MSHTPGSWTFDTSTGHIIAGDEQGWEVVGQALNPANGVMIAAAPELLAALRELCDEFEIYAAVDDETTTPYRALIAKAEGREP